jgi:2-polyprenyl-6-hydroxyphenyl methylase/3-demethylubiquinone-9 3-methyltransferase
MSHTTATPEATPGAVTPAGVGVGGNHDPAEIARFDSIAQRWWDPKGEFRPLHALNPVRLEYVATRSGLAGKRVLDVGCGGGLLSEAMALRGATVTGIDLGEATIEVATLHALQAGVSVIYLRQAAEEHAAAAAGRYDVVTCMEMLEHVPEPGAVLQALFTLVRPGGDVFVSTLNRNLRSFALAIVGAEYLLGLLERGTHTYERFIRPSELARWARAAQLSVLDIAGLHYNPFTDQAGLGHDVAVNYMMHLRRDAA